MDFTANYVPTLPDDVLRSIFELNVVEDSCIALRLSHICRHWRSLCLATSTLWRNIYVVNDYDTYFSIPTSCLSTYYGSSAKKSWITYPEFQQLQHYLHLSGNGLLDVVVRIEMPHRTARNDEADNGCYGVYHQRTRTMARLLSRHSHRIRSLEVKADTYNGALSFFRALHSTGTSPRWGPIASSLRSPPDETQREWGQLEECRLQWTGLTEAFEEMSKDLQNQYMLTFLRDSISIFDPSRSGPRILDPSLAGDASSLPHIATAPLLLPRLRSLTICGLAVEWSFFAPADLEELHLLEMHGDIKPTFNQLRAILLGSQHSLEILSLVDVCESIDASSRYSEDHECLLPKVHTLTLGYIGPDHLFPVTEFMRFPAMKNLMIRNPGQRLLEPTTKGFPGAEETHFSLTCTLLTEMADNWDLGTLESIVLEDVQLTFDTNIEMPPDPIRHMDEVEQMFENWDDDLERLPVEFWQRCIGLKTLRLVRPDPWMLYSLYCPAPGYMSVQYDMYADRVPEIMEEERLSEGSWIRAPRGELLRFPVPYLETLQLEKISEKAARDFARTRKALLKRARGGGSLSRITRYLLAHGI